MRIPRKTKKVLVALALNRPTTSKQRRLWWKYYNWTQRQSQRNISHIYEWLFNRKEWAKP